LPLAMRAAQEAVLQHRRRRARLWLCSRRESFLAMTAETHFAGELRRDLIGRYVLCSRVGRPQAGRCDQANEAGGDPGSDTRDTPAHPKILGGGASVRRGRDHAALAGRLQTDTPIVTNSAEFAEFLFR
jgi:hypothetical protein